MEISDSLFFGIIGSILLMILIMSGFDAIQNNKAHDLCEMNGFDGVYQHMKQKIICERIIVENGTLVTKYKLITYFKL